MEHLNQIPPKAILCDWEYSIIIEHNPTTSQDVSTVCWGTSDSNLQIIKVNDLATVERAQETILHEFIHIIDHRLLHGENPFTEKQIVALSHGLRSLLKNNPDLVQYFIR